MPHSQYTIRPTQFCDAESLPAIEHSASLLFLEAGVECAENYNEVLSAEAHRSIIKHGFSLVAQCAHGQLIGFLAAAHSSDALYIYEISVRRAFQRRGVGRLLMQEIARRYLEPRINSIWLETDTETAWNAPFYRTLGYSDVDIKRVPPAVQELANEDPRNAPSNKGRVWMTLNIEARLGQLDVDYNA